MKLRHDPFHVFRGSQTPAGLYARQKWLGEADTPGWQTDFQEVVEKLLADQMPDGSWQHAITATITALFGLHLTVRSADGRIGDALNWLLSNIQIRAEGIEVQTEAGVKGAALEGLPLVSSRAEMLLIGAALFLCSIFNRQSDPAVLSVYHRLNNDNLINDSLTRDIASMHNIFRALVVHPVYAHEDLTAAAVGTYADLQKKEGDWGNRLPFYQTVNALAHLDLPAAQVQLECAFARLLETQNSDGTWGRCDTEWNTFLCIHALKNKGIL